MRPAFASAYAAHLAPASYATHAPSAASYATHPLPPITQQLPHTLRMLPQLPHPPRIRSLLHAAATTHITMFKKKTPASASPSTCVVAQLIN